MEEKKKIKKSSIILYALISIFAFLTVYISIQVIVGNANNRPPRVFGLSVAYVPTGSMEPVIHKGDYVMFGATSFDDVKEDDIIVYYNPTEKKCIIHRVNKIVTTGDEKYLVAKGDANVAIDNIHITKDLLIGKYIGKVDFLKVFSGGVNNFIIYIIIVLLVIVFLVLQIISILIKAKKEKLIEERENEKNLLREEMKNEILREELEKLKNKDNK